MKHLPGVANREELGGYADEILGFFDTELVVLCSCDCLGRAICEKM